MVEEKLNLDRYSGENKYLIFALGDESYGIPLLEVKEVIAVPETTPLPFTPKHFRGIMNLRGQVISIIDLREKFHIPTESDEASAVIICDIDPFCIGVVVDSVVSVLNATKAIFSQKPEIERYKAHDYVENMCQHNEQLILLLNLRKALIDEQHNLLSAFKSA